MCCGEAPGIRWWEGRSWVWGKAPLPVSIRGVVDPHMFAGTITAEWQDDAFHTVPRFQVCPPVDAQMGGSDLTK